MKGRGTTTSYTPRGQSAESWIDNNADIEKKPVKAKESIERYKSQNPKTNLANIGKRLGKAVMGIAASLLMLITVAHNYIDLDVKVNFEVDIKLKAKTEMRLIQTCRQKPLSKKSSIAHTQNLKCGGKKP